MNWLSKITPGDRVFSVLVYCFALLDIIALSFLAGGNALLFQVPFLSPILPAILGVILIYKYPVINLLGGTLVIDLSFIIFILLFALVVRNPRWTRFLRYNTMQTIMIGIVSSLCYLTLDTFLAPIGGFPLAILVNTIVIFLFGIAVYSMVHAAQRKYANVSIISDAVRAQVP